MNKIISKEEAVVISWIAKTSKLAYQEKHDIEKELGQWTMELQNFQFIYEKQYDVQAFVFSTDKSVIVSFRGTEKNKLEDWMVDLHFSLTDMPWGQVHKGFYEAYCTVNDECIKSIHNFRDRNQNLYITGHSLGGALAVLLASELYIRHTKGENRSNLNGLYNFAQPTVGNSEFIRNFDEQVPLIRIVNEYDIVPVVPFHTHKHPYLQSDQPAVVLTEKSNYRIEQRGNSKWDFWKIISYLYRDSEKESIENELVSYDEMTAMKECDKRLLHEKHIKIMEWYKNCIFNFLGEIGKNHEMPTYIDLIENDILEPLSIKNPPMPF